MVVGSYRECVLSRPAFTSDSIFTFALSQGSSVGQLSSNWLAVFHRVILGLKPWTMDGAAPQHYRPPFKIMFPTLAEVDASIGGRPGGGTIFCKRETWGVSPSLRVF